MTTNKDARAENSCEHSRKTYYTNTLYLSTLLPLMLCNSSNSNTQNRTQLGTQLTSTETTQNKKLMMLDANVNMVKNPTVYPLFGRDRSKCRD